MLNVDRPQVISDFFHNLNCVDSHNHARQFELLLEKWVTHDCYYCLTTSKIGIDVTDTWQLMIFHKLFPFPIMQRYNESEYRHIPVKAFAGILSAQLLRKAAKIEEAAAELRKRKYYDLFSSEDSETGGITTSKSIKEINNDEGDGLAFLTNGGRLIEGCKVVNSFKDGNGDIGND